MAKSATKNKPRSSPQARPVAAKVADQPAVTTKRVHPLVVAFVVFHVVAITIYALPKPSQAVLDGKIEPRGSDFLLKYNQQVFKESSPIYGYLFVTGMWQYWDMFAPDPAQTDMWCSADVEYLDGTKKPFAYPHIKDLSIPLKFISERHRKFLERAAQDNMAYFWPPFGQAIAYQAATDPNNPPVSVTLIRHFQPVARHDSKNPQEPPYSTYAYYNYVVDQEKLYSDKGWKFGLH